MVPTSIGELDLYDLVAVSAEPVDAETFAGRPVGGPYGRIFGGQLIGQAVTAATATVDEERMAHSLHAYFLRAGRADQPVAYDVERVRDGGSFSVRSVTARQGGRVLVRAAVSFQVHREALAHQADRPRGYPDPEDLPAEDDTVEALGPDGERPVHRGFVELRRVLGRRDETGAVTGQAVWMRARRPRGSRSDAVHRATLALATDYTVLETVVRTHDLTFQTPGLAVASLDHSVWWHAPASLDDWVLYVQENPWSGGERGLMSGRIYDREGRLLVTVAQEGLLRWDGANGGRQ